MRGRDVSEIERIRKMANEGTITDEEADRLIALLQDIDHTEAQVDAVASEAATASPPSEPTPPDMSRARAAPAGADDAAPSAPTGAAPAGDGSADAERDGGDRAHARAEAKAAEKAAEKRAETAAARAAAAGAGTFSGSDAATDPGRLPIPDGLRWFRIPTLAGDFDIRVDESLEAPRVEGPEGFTVKESHEGWKLVSKEGSSFFDRLLSGQLGRDFDIRLPAYTGVDLQIKAGDVDMRGVPFLKGQILAGDVSARDLKGIDLRMSAGDLDIWVTPTEGEHRIEMTAGDVDVRLGSGSDVRVEGRVNIGDASMPDEFQLKRSGLGESFSGTVGGGTARLVISQSTGDAQVRVDE